MPKPEPSERRCHELTLLRARDIVAAWGDLPRRQRLLAELHTRLLASQHPQLHPLAQLCTPSATPAQLDQLLILCQRQSRGRLTPRATAAQLLAPAIQPTGTQPAIQTGDAPGSAAPPMPFTVLCVNLRSAFNLGGIFRTVDCFGGQAVWGCGYTADPSNPAVQRAAMGTDQWVGWRHFLDPGDALAELKKNDIKIIALETVPDAPDLAGFTWPFPCALLLGNERDGLDPALLRHADACVRITMYGRKNSLNVASALAVAAASARAAWQRHHPCHKNPV